MLGSIGSYRLLRILGEGGMGVVYLAEHTVLKRRVAIKVLSAGASSAVPGAAQRFLDEAQVTAAIEDPGIVQMFDFAHTPDGRAYIVMEYLEGERLDQRVERTGPLPINQALRIIRQLASSLRAAHARDVLHRDLKPENILLVTDPAVAGGERTKLLDFGICKLMHRNISHTCTGTIVGTPTYMSPEQCRGERDLDARSDVYSLGCVLLYLVTGHPPFPYRSTGELLAAHLKEPAPRARSLRQGVSPDLDSLIARCLAKSLEDRVPSMGALVDELSQLLVGTTGEIDPATSLTSYVRATPASPTLTIALAADYATAPTRASAEAAATLAARFTWARRAAIAAFAALMLSAPAAPPTMPAVPAMPASVIGNAAAASAPAPTVTSPTVTIPTVVVAPVVRAPVVRAAAAPLTASAVSSVRSPTPSRRARALAPATSPLSSAEPGPASDPAAIPASPEPASKPPAPRGPIDGGPPVDAAPAADAAGDTQVLIDPWQSAS